MPTWIAVAAERSLRTLARLPTERIGRERWIRCRIEVVRRVAAGDRTLTPLDEAHLAELRSHPEHGADQVVSGFRFWDHGLRRAYGWWDQGVPLAITWLLTPSDNPRLRTLPTWSGMYPPLPDRVGHMENTYLFRAGRRSRVATELMRAAIGRAASLGLVVVRTHIADTNRVALGRALRFGWRRCGTVVRYRFDAPGLRHLPVCLHTCTSPEPS